MKAVNLTIKFLGYVGAYLLTFFESYLLSLVFTPFIICIVLSVTSALHIMKLYVLTHFYVVYLLSSIPLAVVFFVYVLIGYAGKFTYGKKMK